ncbi:DUF2786 domain-containing protein [Rhodococcus triatomae]|nr:hypothetical protein G419_13676 [Rhodococcus triatomae BKS 15-14]
MGSIRTDIREGRAGGDDAALLRHAYEIGWQPGDVLHVARRGLAAVELAPIALLIQREAHRSGAWARAPLHWVDQLKAIASVYPRRPDEPPLSTAAARLLGRLAPLRRLCPPPSQWPDIRPDDTGTRTGTDAKVLGRIRGLLAKAESTEFTEEAETLTAKAQELMTRHSVTTALLDATSPDRTVAVHARRIHLDRPYSKHKGLLLTSVGDANHVRTLFNPVDAIATVVGTPADLEQVDLLFTSLLIQATRAMRVATTRGTTPSESGAHTTNTAAFRRAFLYGFAVRIGQRLTEAEKSATAEAVVDAGVTFGALLPLLARRSDAVQAEVDRLFGPALRSWGFTVSDHAGMAAGRTAADAASLTPGPRAVTR